MKVTFPQFVTRKFQSQNMDLILIWLLAYCAPAVMAGIFPYVFTSDQVFATKVAHFFVAISILTSLYFIHSLDLEFPWPNNFVPVGIYIFTLIVSAFILGKIGIIYGFSALLQELTMTLIAFLLLRSLPFPLIILMIVPLFVLGHNLENPHRYFKIFLFSIGGSVFLGLFALGVNIFYITALHILIGTWLIKTGFIYRFVRNQSHSPSFSFKVL